MNQKKLFHRDHRRGITSFRRKLLCLIVLFFFSSNIAFANPNGPQVVNGNVSFSMQGSNLTITNSPNSIINWQGFSIGINELTRFIQQSGNSAVLNRVIGQDISAILGALQSNGRVFLINPNGILFGAGARIDVNGLIASTLNLSNQDFLAGKYNFTAGLMAGSIENQGIITTPTGGQVYLIAPDIKNTGIINSPKGDVILAAGRSVQLVDSMNPDIAVVVSAPENSVVNLGKIIADSGRIGIYGGLINQKGIVRADSAVLGENGQILFKATKGITLDKDSITTANGPTGGKITIQSETGVTVASGAAVTATGENGTVTVNVTGNNITDNQSIAFENRGTIEAETVNAQTWGSGYAFGMANYGSIYGQKRISLTAWDNTVMSPGTIRTDAGGAVSLLAGHISLEGMIKSEAGKVDTFSTSFDLSGTIDVSTEKGKGGTIDLYVNRALDAIYDSRLIADGKEGGTISVNASNQGRYFTSGTMLARGTETTGGTISVTGGNVSLFGGTADASGVTEGGRIYWGGNRQGKGLLANAGQAMVTPGSTLLSNGEQGGEIIVWSDSLTRFYGTAKTGNRGFIEVSSGDRLTYNGLADAGNGGSVLFDPRNLEIVDGIPSALQMIKIAYGTPGITLANGDYFGYGVSLDGDRLAVGASQGATGGTGGAVYLFDGLNSTNFAAAAMKRKLAHGTAGITLANGDYFGVGVSLDGDRLAVGASGDDTGGTARGAVYLFDGLNSANFASAAMKRKLDSTTAGITLANNDYFGWSVSLDGNHLAVGAYGDDTGGTARGAGYLFDGLNSANFASAAMKRKLDSTTVGITLADGDWFGSSVSLDGDRLAVGAAGDSTGGAVYLFDGLNSTNFASAQMQRKLAHGTAGITMADGGTSFGTSVSLDGNRLAVGDPGDSTGGTERGAVYLFDGLNSTNFASAQMQRKLVHGTAGLTLADGDAFGTGVSLDGDSLAVGAAIDSTGGMYRGAVYLFDGLNSANFASATMQRKLSSTTIGTTLADSDWFGIRVSLDGDRLAVGAMQDSTGGITNGGAVYLFDGLNSANFASTAMKRKLAHGTAGLTLADYDNFGSAVSLDGDRLAVGAYGDDTGGGITNGGAVYLFDGLNSTNFASAAMKRKLAHGTAGITLTNGDSFGGAVSLDGDRLAVGTDQDDTGGIANSGAVYLFDGLNSANFASTAMQRKLAHGTAGLTLADSDNFGSAVSLDGNRLAVGAYRDDTGGITNSGAVYLFQNPFTPLYTSTSGINYALEADLDSQMTVQSILASLNNGSSVTLQANNDITLSTALTANNNGGNGGNLSLAAGRSILLNANITTDNGNLSLIANDTLANGVQDAHRLAGNAVITMGAGTAIDAGTGTVSIDLKDGAGKTNKDTGTITLNAITGSSVSIKNNGSTAGGGISVGAVNASGDLSLTANGSITQTGAITADGLALRGTGSYTLTNASNKVSKLASDATGTIDFKNSASFSVDSVDDLNGVSTNGQNITLATAVGDLLLNKTVTTGGTTTGSITLNAAGALVNGISSSDKNVVANSLSATAGNGIGHQKALKTKVSNLTANNTSGSRNIEFDNEGALTIASGITNSGSGNVVLDNTGAVDTGSTKITASGGSVTMTAHSPLTVGSGGVTAESHVTLEASESGGDDTLTINGPVKSNSGNISLKAGSEIKENVAVEAPNGTVTRTVNGTVITPSSTTAATPATQQEVQAVVQAENTTVTAMNNTDTSSVEQKNDQTAPPPEKKEETTQSDSKSSAKKDEPEENKDKGKEPEKDKDKEPEKDKDKDKDKDSDKNSTKDTKSSGPQKTKLPFCN